MVSVSFVYSSSLSPSLSLSVCFYFLPTKYLQSDDEFTQTTPQSKMDSLKTIQNYCMWFDHFTFVLSLTAIAQLYFVGEKLVLVILTNTEQHFVIKCNDLR